MGQISAQICMKIANLAILIKNSSTIINIRDTSHLCPFLYLFTSDLLFKNRDEHLLNLEIGELQRNIRTHVNLIDL